MKGFFGVAGGGGPGGPQPNPLIATSGKWFANVVGLWAAIFLTPDLWTMTEGMIWAAISARYDGLWAEAVYWLLKIAAYPLTFFGVRLSIGLAFVSAAMWLLLHVFGGRR